jgi:hypothetical protein
MLFFSRLSHEFANGSDDLLPFAEAHAKGGGVDFGRGSRRRCVAPALVHRNASEDDDDDDDASSSPPSIDDATIPYLASSSLLLSK